MHPPVADSEDPTTQIAWPSRRKKNYGQRPSASEADVDHMEHASDSDSDTVLEQEDVVDDHPGIPAPTRKPLTTWNLITLSISMAGAQIAWTVELG